MDDLPLSRTASPRLEIVESTGSTNADLVALVATHPGAWPHLSVLLTDDQRAGRGRLDRTWVTPAGRALAVSVVLDVSGIPLAARGWVPLIAGAAMTRAVGAALQGTTHTVGLKWPNDVLVDGAKICGILAEGVPGHPGLVVAGAGINTRMPDDHLPVRTATSFEALGVDVDEDALLHSYLRALAEQFTALAAANGDVAASGVRAEVEALCVTLHREVRALLPDGSEVLGAARRLTSGGALVIEPLVGTESVIAAGDIIHLR
jgi:BirA family transcriptional regulator, biotin operon repressor / biotin---[acetyl-CoA-carboxylase] ligase